MNVTMKNLYIFNHHLQLLVKSPNFIAILISIIFTMYKICVDSPMLWDDTDIQTLYELKAKLITEISNHRIAQIKHEQYVDLQELLNQRSTPKWRNYTTEKFYCNKIEGWGTEKINTLNKINLLENEIKKMQPNSKSVFGSIASWWNK